MGVVESVFDTVANVVGDVVDIVVDNVIEPVANLVTDVVDAALSDPIGTIAKAYAIGTGQLYLLPYIAAASTAVNGGSLLDVAKAAAISTIAQAVGAEVSAYAGTAGTAAELGVNVGSEQAAQLALQEAGMGSLTSITNSIAASSLGSAAAAVVTGQDPLAALASGGIGAAVPAALGQIEGFKELQRSSPAVANVITKAITTELQGGDVGASALNSLIISSGIAAKAINAFDPNKKMTDAERAVATNLIIDTTRAAVKGGDISAAMNASLVSSAINSLGKIVTPEFKTKVAVASSNYTEATVIAKDMSANENRQKMIIEDYNNIVAQIDIRSEEQFRLKAIDEEHRAKYNELKAAGASIDVLNGQAALIDVSTAVLKDYVTDFSSYISEVKPKLDSKKTELNALQKNETVLQTDLTETLEKQVELTKPVSGITTVATNDLNESFTKIIDPTFNAKEYAEINGLDANVNAYTDFMEKGRDAGVPTNLKSARAEIGKERTRLVNEVLAAKGLSLDTADPATVSKLLDSLDSTYGNNLGELRGASIQDVISGNTRTVEELVADSKKPFRVEVAGSAYGDWKKPAEATFKVPEGYRLATTEEFESKQAQALLASDGNSVYLVPDGATGRVVWNEAAGAYEPQSIPVLGLPPTETEVYSVAAKNDKVNEGLFSYIASQFAGGFGEQFQDYTSGFALTFKIDQKNTASNFSQSMIDWGKENTPTGMANQVKDIGSKLEAAYKVEGKFNQAKAVFDAIKDNPSGYMAYLLKEQAQNIIPIGGGMAAAALAATLGAPVAVGLTAATVFSVVAEGLQVYGNTGKEVYDARIKAGDSEEVARSKAILAGVKSAAVAAPTDAVSNALIFAPYLRALGVAANVGLKGATAVIASTAGEVIEDFTTGAIKELAINPDKPLPVDKLWVNSVFAGMVASGTTGITIAPAMLDGSLVIGFDNNNKGVTYGEYRADPSVLDISRIDTNVVVGKTSDNKNVTLGDLVTSNNATDLNKAVAEATGTSIPPEIERVIDPLVTDEAEVRAAFEAIGYQPSQEDINNYIGNKKETDALGALDSKYNPLVTTVSEAQQMARDLGYTNLTNAEAQNLAGQIKETDAQKAIESYVGQHMVSADTVKQLFAKAGINNPTAAQIAQFTKAGPTVNAETVKAQLNTYADPLGVNEAEARATFKALGLANPTEEDVQALMGTYSESLLSSKAVSALKDAAKNAQFKSQYDSLNDGQKILTNNLISQGLSREEAIAITKTDTSNQVSGVTPEMREQYEALTAAQKAAADAAIAQGNTIQAAIQAGQAVSAQQITDVETKLSTAIQAARDVGLQGDAALQAAINSVAAEMGVNKTTLLNQLGTTEAALRADFASGLAGVTQSVADTRTSLEAAIADAKASGLQGDAALKSAIDKVAADQNTSSTALLAKLGTTEAGLRTEFATGLAGVTANVAATKTALEAAIADAKATGLSGDAALQVAINKVAADQQISKTQLLAQLGATETSLRTEFASGLAGVSADVAATRTLLEAAIADAKAAGLQGDAALQAAINKVAADQNLSKEQLLSQLGKTEAALRTEFATGIAGLSADMQAKYDALSESQKATADALVAQGKSTQEAIATAQATTTAQIAGVTAEMQAQYNSLNAAQKATADALVSQGETFQNALTAAQASTAGQIAGLSADMQAKFDALNAGQKQFALDLVDQGRSTQEAIAAASAATADQIAGVTAEMRSQYNTLTTAQKAAADALIAQGETFQTALAAAQASTAGQIAGLSADMQAKFNTLNADQKQLALDLVAQGRSTQEAIDIAQRQTAEQITASTSALNARIDQLIAEGKTQQEASRLALAEANAKIGTQGRAPNQSDLDTLQQMIEGKIPADIRYDTNNDGRITPADYDFLTNIVTRPNVEDPFKPGPGSIWSPTGLYGELDEAERAREQDRLKLEEQRAKDVEAQKAAAAQESLRSQRQAAGTATRQALQEFVGTAPTLIRQATQQEATPIYGGAIKEFDFGAPLDYSFFEPSKEKQGSQTGQQTTKIATGGYLEDLLAENMTADDLLKLLR